VEEAIINDKVESGGGGGGRIGSIGEWRRERLLADAKRSARQIAGEQLPWSRPFADLLRAGIAVLQGDRPATLELLDEAARGFDDARMALYAAAAALPARSGARRRGGRGGAIRERTLDARRRDPRPPRMVAVLAPGFD